MTLSVSATPQLLADERSSHRRNAPMFTFVPTLRHLVVRAVNVLQDLRNAIFDTYRPELYYMRGPGPRWHAKHGGRVHRAISFDLAKNALQSNVPCCAGFGGAWLGIATRVAARGFTDWLTARGGFKPVKARSPTASSRDSAARCSTSTLRSKDDAGRFRRCTAASGLRRERQNTGSRLRRRPAQPTAIGGETN